MTPPSHLSSVVIPAFNETLTAVRAVAEGKPGRARAAAGPQPRQAVRAGMLAATGRIRLVSDADGQLMRVRWRLGRQ